MTESRLTGAKAMVKSSDFRGEQPFPSTMSYQNPRSSIFSPGMNREQRTWPMVTRVQAERLVYV